MVEEHTVHAISGHSVSRLSVAHITRPCCVWIYFLLPYYTMFCMHKREHELRLASIIVPTPGLAVAHFVRPHFCGNRRRVHFVAMLTVFLPGREKVYGKRKNR